MRHAACRDQDPELFFSQKSGNGSRADAARAVQICGQCPVIAQCRQYAKDIRACYGVFGGRLLTGTGKPLPHVLCGTESGAGRHRRRNETVCTACRKAASKAREKRRERATTRRGEAVSV